MTVGTRAFWAAAAERAIKTAAQTLSAALIMASAPVDVLHVNWVGVLSVTAGATLLSLLTSLASINVGVPGTPAAVAENTYGAHAAPLKVSGADQSPLMGPDGA